MPPIPTVYIHLKPCLEFVRPYIERELESAWEIVQNPDDAEVSVAVMELNDVTPAHMKEADVTLHCPWTIGTGMKGVPRRIAAGIRRGSYHHIKGNADTRHAVVHAVDVAQACRVALQSGLHGHFTVTDGHNPTVDTLAEAISWRMGQKRLFTTRHFLARLMMGQLYDEVTTTVEASTSPELVEAGFVPVEVTDYLKTHVYDESSL